MSQDQDANISSLGRHPELTPLSTFFAGGVLQATLPGTATSATGSMPFSPTELDFVVEAIDICGGTVNQLNCALLCEEGPTFVRGDCNADGSNNIADVVAALGFLFGGTGTPLCADSCDLNDDGGLDISDPVFLLSNLFSSGSNPAAPYPNNVESGLHHAGENFRIGRCGTQSGNDFCLA